VDEKRRKVVGSMRQAKPVNTKEMEVFWNGIIIGKELTGKVKNFTSFGAFIDLGGVDGLVHNTELSWEKNMAPEDIFEIGQEVSVWVKDFDPEARRVSLGYRKAEDNPWNKYAGQVSEGDILNVKIVRISPFGAFAEIFPGIDGLIHISELDVGRVDNVSSKVKVGQEVEVKVIKIDDEKGKISLSIAALLDGYIIKDAEKELNADDTAPHLQ
ncbi:MAG: S1 RNA-binding domain-containing protein, partial [Oscillospiraceae bacterium]|nr:S1 RNA-binding domain-containing protein [Oscillospiraceae bacterium]